MKTCALHRELAFLLALTSIDLHKTIKNHIKRGHEDPDFRCDVKIRFPSQNLIEPNKAQCENKAQSQIMGLILSGLNVVRLGCNE